MQKTFNKAVLLLLCLIVTGSTFFVYSQQLPSSTKSLQEVSKEYWKIYSNFKNKVCKPGNLNTFNKKLSTYRGEGFYLPIIDNKIYPEVLDGVLSELELKRKWLVATILSLQKIKKLPNISKELKTAQASINSLLKIQEKHFRFNKKISQKELEKKKSLLVKITKDLKQAIDKSPYLTRYRFPVDHFSNRRQHDAYYRDKKNLKSRKEQKEIFLLRKLLEDGVPGKSHSGSDKFFRTALDTVALKLPSLETEQWLTEPARYDLEYIIKTMRKLSKNSPWHYVERFRKWRDKTKEQITFYKDLRLKAKSFDKSLKAKLAAKKRATTQLSSFVKNKQFETYKFWMKQPAYYRALYALETILFNEVGNVDPSGLERSDVLQVVLNRYKQKYYRRLKKNQSLYKLTQANNIGRSQFPWLNILLNRGEFSFTLYYFKASHETFCPSLNNKLQKLRDENLKIAFEILKKPNFTFKAERYFSRASMTGRIDMSQIWSNFKELDERPGRKIKDKSKLKQLNRKMKWNNYRYLYSFNDALQPEGKLHVVEVEGHIYVFRQTNKTKEWFGYRNPHYFRYFSVK